MSRSQFNSASRPSIRPSLRPTTIRSDSTASSRRAGTGYVGAFDGDVCRRARAGRRLRRGAQWKVSTELRRAGAPASMRCAMPTGWPTAVYLPGPEPISPTITSPEFSPTRICKCNAVAATHLACKFFGDGLDFQRRNACPQRMVLQRHRGAEQCHQAVAGELVKGSLIALHHRRSAVEQLVHDLLESLRVQRRRKLHRADDVGEQHRHLLVLACCRCRRDRRSRTHRRSAPLARRSLPHDPHRSMDSLTGLTIPLFPPPPISLMIAHTIVEKTCNCENMLKLHRPSPSPKLTFECERSRGIRQNVDLGAR